MSDHVLNLDELFGKAKPVKVEMNGVIYELSRPENFIPAQFQMFINLFNKFGRKKLNKNIDTLALDQIMDELLNMLNKDLVTAINETGSPFSMKLKVIEFYHAEALQGTVKKGKESSKKPTGA